MVKTLLFIALLAFLFSFPFSQEEQSSNVASQPQPTPRSCLQDSDIDRSTRYECQSGPNVGDVYYRIAVLTNIEITKKQLFIGEWDPSIPLPQSCIDAGLGSGPIIPIADRAIRPSERCRDPSLYEVWCGDYCDRFIETRLREPNRDITTIPLCGTNPNDDYLGCFNEAFLFKLKEGETFTQGAPNTFDVYIKDGASIPASCRDIVARYQQIAADKGITIDPGLQAQFQCYSELQISIRCPN